MPSSVQLWDFVSEQLNKSSANRFEAFAVSDEQIEQTGGVRNGAMTAVATPVSRGARKVEFHPQPNRAQTAAGTSFSYDAPKQPYPDTAVFRPPAEHAPPPQPQHDSDEWEKPNSQRRLGIVPPQQPQHDQVPMNKHEADEIIRDLVDTVH